MTEPNPTSARNDNPPQAGGTPTDESTEEDGQLANPGPIPPEPEDATDIGDRPGDLAPQAGGPGEEDPATKD